MKTIFTLFLSIFLLGLSPTNAQNNSDVAESVDSNFLAMKWRNIGPFRGGRSTTCSGVIGDPLTYYFGSVGGGVWKTKDAGLTWKNISDGYIDAGSIGAVSVSESDPNVIYAGTGEACIRGVMTSHGDGVYRSTDAGKSWKHIGLENTLQIAQIRIHPQDPDLVYVAAQGSPYAPTKDRGIYRSKDGGNSWEQVLFIDENSGANNLSIDVNNPRILYACIWDHDRDPWFVRSGGPGSGIWKSTDGGDNWTQLKKGLPSSMGKTAISVSPANSDVVYAVIEADKSGLYKSMDAGESWKLINDKRILITRSWYYMHVFADPINENLVYVLNAPFLTSIDGGKSFKPVQVPHGDNHDLWINPDNPQNMISSDDGGATISFNGGKTWSTQKNQSTAQFYRVNADNRIPYWVYGGQQDNSTVAIPSSSHGTSIDWQDWRANVGGGEAAHIAFDPNNPRYIYSSNITGMIDEYDWETRKQKFIKPYPIFDLGEPSDQMKYRYNWNPPVIVSQHDPKVIYYGSQLVHKSSDRGISWKDISKDLTRNNSENLGLMGGPFTNEAAGAETYHTIMTLAESPHSPEVLYSGADDGKVFITRDGGKTWNDVSPGPEGIINSIDVSRHNEGIVLITLMRYKFNDYKPYVYQSNNFGKDWKLITNGIPNMSFARVARQDTEIKGLLYAGTERGIYISFDNGRNWEKWQLNLPVVPITDLKVHNGDLIAATHGRGFWILDDLGPAREFNNRILEKSAFLYAPKPVILTGEPISPAKNPLAGRNPFKGASIKYYLNKDIINDSLEVYVEILDAKNNLIRTLSSDNAIKANKISKHHGMNEARWDLRHEQIKVADHVMMPPGQTQKQAHIVAPGNYQVRLVANKDTLAGKINVMEDPRDEISPELRKEKHEMLVIIYSQINDIYRSVDAMQEVRDQIKILQDREGQNEDIMKSGALIISKIDTVESNIISPKQKTFQDVINFRNQLDFQLYYLYSNIDGNLPPLTNGEKELHDELSKNWENQKERVIEILQKDVSSFNKMLEEKKIPFIAPKKSEKKKKGA